MPILAVRAFIPIAVIKCFFTLVVHWVVVDGVNVVDAEALPVTIASIPV